MKKKVLVLGCTGSIGTSALDIINSFPDKFELVGISAHTSADKLKHISQQFNCKNVCLSGLKTTDSDIGYSGKTGLLSFIENTQADIAVNGIAGSAGLLPSVYALKSGMDLALANKETMVMAGSLIKSLAKEKNCRILPVDSEHSAVFMLLQNRPKETLDSIILTASGGPFRTYTKEQLENVKPTDALKHPTWNMGQKITIDSATLANKGLEVIEACMLFDVPPERVQVLVHPQSIVHSLIRTTDGVMYAQLSKPDMRHPILSALSFPNFLKNNLEKLDFLNFEKGSTLSFFPPDKEKFKMLDLAYQAIKANNSSTIVYNAADEIAVSHYLKGKISFLDIPEIIEQVLQYDWSGIPSDYNEVFEIDIKSRQLTENIIKNRE